MRRLRCASRQLRFGLHSRIPLCCIAEYVVRGLILGEREPSESNADRVDRWIGVSRGNLFAYVPCLLCCVRVKWFGGQPRRIHYCSLDGQRCDRYLSRRVLQEL